MSRKVLIVVHQEKSTPGRVGDFLVARGYQEAVTYSFVDPELQHRVNPDMTPGRARSIVVLYFPTERRFYTMAHQNIESGFLI